MKNSDTKNYTANDIGIVIPTKDRPQKIDNLLNSLANQELEYGQIIIVYIGVDITNVVNKYKDKLNVELYKSEKAGQLIQRNYGISRLSDSIKLVALFDDDIVVEKDAFNSIIEFTNHNELAGVSFNITNHPREKFSLFKYIFGLTGKYPGKVLRSGLTTSNINVVKDIKTQWLCGGATLWEKHIIDNYKHKDIITKWAIAEDLIFSYPIGKLYPLYVCSKAHVRHEHINDYVTEKHELYHGYNQTIWLYYFVNENDDLSHTLFFYSVLVRLIGKLFIGIVKLDGTSIDFAKGQYKGMCACIRTFIFKDEIEDLISKG